MAGSDVLLAVSQTLQNRLTAGLSTLGPPVPEAELHDLNGPPTTNPPRATLFLYDVVEEPTSRNRPPTGELVGGRVVSRKRPLGLCLYYLVTAWGKDPVTEQRILGRVIQVFHEDSIIDGPDLADELAGTGVELRISLSRMQIDDRARIWWAINKPYRLSINYEVRVVDVDADVTTSTTPVVSRRLVVGAGS
jgi:Pvc16 N-terminal domain